MFRVPGGQINTAGDTVVIKESKALRCLSGYTIGELIEMRAVMDDVNPVDVGKPFFEQLTSHHVSVGKFV